MNPVAELAIVWLLVYADAVMATLVWLKCGEVVVEWKRCVRRWNNQGA